MYGYMHAMGMYAICHRIHGWLCAFPVKCLIYMHAYIHACTYFSINSVSVRNFRFFDFSKYQKYIHRREREREREGEILAKIRFQSCISYPYMHTWTNKYTHTDALVEIRFRSGRCTTRVSIPRNKVSGSKLRMLNSASIVDIKCAHCLCLHVDIDIQNAKIRFKLSGAKRRRANCLVVIWLESSIHVIKLFLCFYMAIDMHSTYI
jgi:hypothetical protein